MRPMLMYCNTQNYTGQTSHHYYGETLLNNRTSFYPHTLSHHSPYSLAIPDPNDMLLEAVSNNDINLVRKALEEGANVNTRVIAYMPLPGTNFRKKVETTPLLIASWENYPEIVTLLIESGADVNIRDEKGRTPLHWAALHANQELVNWLVLREIT